MSESEDRWSFIEKDFLDGSVTKFWRGLYQPWKDGSLNNGRKVGRQAATIERPIWIMPQYMEVLIITDREGESWHSVFTA